MKIKKRHIFIPSIFLSILVWGVFSFYKIFLTNASYSESLAETITTESPIHQAKYTPIESFNRAMSYANHLACESIQDENQKIECRDYAFIIEVGKHGDNRICEGIVAENRKTECYDISLEKIATEKGEKWLCNPIQNENARLRCQETIDSQKLKKIIQNGIKSTTECEGLDKNFYKECIQFVKNYTIEENYIHAVHENNIGFCTLLGDRDLETRCRDEVISYRAESENNAEMCQNIISTDKKNICLQKIQNLSDIKTLKFAIEWENIALCQSIVNSEQRESCEDIIHLAIIKKTKNYSLCEHLHSENNKNTCHKIKNS